MPHRWDAECFARRFRERLHWGGRDKIRGMSNGGINEALLHLYTLHTSFVSELPGFCCGCWAAFVPYLFLFSPSGSFSFLHFYTLTSPRPCYVRLWWYYALFCTKVRLQLFLPFLMRLANGMIKKHDIFLKEKQSHLFLLIYFCHYSYYRFIFYFNNPLWNST